jgi:hypothetical protein
MFFCIEKTLQPTNYNAGVVNVNLKVVGLAPVLKTKARDKSA